LPRCVQPESANAQAISVAEYAAVFFQRVVKNEYSEDDAENAREAGKAFVGAHTLQLRGRGVTGGCERRYVLQQPQCAPLVLG